ncbi:MAG: pinensin family lanthipeptide [Bacteroidota bacterium]
MKNRKIKLSELKVSSFVTEQIAKIRGGERLTEAFPCAKPHPAYSENCEPSYDCVKSMDYICTFHKTAGK